MRPFLIPHLLEESATRVPDKTAVIEPAGVLSYGGLLDRSRRIASALLEAGLIRGGRVGLYLDKSIDQIAAMFGVWFAGGVVVILNPILAKDQILHEVRDCGIRILVFAADKVGAGGRAGLDNRSFAEAGIRGAVGFGAGDKAGFGVEVRTAGDCSEFAPFSGEAPGIADDTSHIIYTSGSTGLPKGIVVSHRNAIDGAAIVCRYTGLEEHDRIFGALPLNFDYGFNQLMNTVRLGATFVLHAFFMPNDLLAALERERVTVFGGMPPIWTKVFNPRLCDLAKPRDFSALRVITNTGGKVPVPVVRKLREFFPSARVFLMYGLTEAFRSTFLDPSEIDRRPDSIGKAIPNCEVFVIDAEGRECAPGREGELVHRGALITKGYWNHPEKTAEVFRPNPLLDPENRHLETVVFSGDIVKKDDEGFIYYVGRRDAMIKTKGYRVSPTEVEELMAGAPGVAECVAAGYEADDEIRLRAFVTLSKPDASAADVLAHCRRHFPFYLVPDDLVVLARFPLTANGKIDRTRVVQEHSGDGAAP
jgi:acyl-CoA ligase (AMP-forming) (exosortase A-associated)